MQASPSPATSPIRVLMDPAPPDHDSPTDPVRPLPTHPHLIPSLTPLTHSQTQPKNQGEKIVKKRSEAPPSLLPPRFLSILIQIAPRFIYPPSEENNSIPPPPHLAVLLASVAAFAVAAAAMATEEAAKPSPLPPYPEMILAAIEGLGGKNGSNKSAISRYIEGKYGELPPAHASLLTAHLARMKESGELIFLKNNYFRADAPDAPPKRGRGRPPKKAKTEAAEAAPSPAPASTGGDGSTPVKRGRGRPPKVRPAVPSETAAA
ncbi:unnamed protein product [Urochloa decumbens]|uniref:HMG-Y-related protein A n=1 Tax=Urochloa decumbens TaxID=240449 RepID=A0ABC9BE24_9POAL